MLSRSVREPNPSRAHGNEAIGQVRLDGKLVRYHAPRPAVRDGIVYVTEDGKVEGFFETMSISEIPWRRGWRMREVGNDRHVGK